MRGAPAPFHFIAKTVIYLIKKVLLKHKTISIIKERNFLLN